MVAIVYNFLMERRSYYDTILKLFLIKWLIMPIKVFGNISSAHDNGNKIDTSIIVQKPYSRTNYKESNIEEDIDWKNQLGIKNLPDPNCIREPASELYVDKKFNHPSIIKMMKMLTSMVEN